MLTDDGIMKHKITPWLYLSSILFLVLPGFKGYQDNRTNTLHLEKEIVLPKVKGGFDLMAIDIKRQRLFVSAEDNHSVEVIDLKMARPLTSIPNLNEPKWVVYRPETNLLYISTGGDGKVSVFNGDTFKYERSFKFKEKCNNLRYDAISHQLYVGVGNTFGALGVIDLQNNQIKKEILLADFPKQFEIDGNRIYVNIPGKNIIQVVDRQLNKVTASWPLEGSTENVPMAIDKLHHRLFVGCEPGKLIIYSTLTGKLVAGLSIHKNADGIYYEAKTGRIYVSCGEGFIEVIDQKTPDNYLRLETLATVMGAGTSLYCPQLNLYILATPQSGMQKAAIRLYKPIA
jgi:DNA-binding beta-propeller fold protein YncE